MNTTYGKAFALLASALFVLALLIPDAAAMEMLQTVPAIINEPEVSVEQNPHPQNLQPDAPDTPLPQAIENDGVLQPASEEEPILLVANPENDEDEESNNDEEIVNRINEQFTQLVNIRNQFADRIAEYCTALADLEDQARILSDEVDAALSNGANTATYIQLRDSYDALKEELKRIHERFMASYETFMRNYMDANAGILGLISQLHDPETQQQMMSAVNAVNNNTTEILRQLFEIYRGAYWRTEELILRIKRSLIRLHGGRIVTA